MSGSRRRSLRGRITLLAVVTCVFLAVAAVLLVRSVRARHAATQTAVEKHLAQLSSTLAERYLQQETNGASLNAVVAQHASRDLAPPRKAAEPAPAAKVFPPQPPSPPLPPATADPLSAVSAGVVGREEDVQGGFVTASGLLVGYAAATQDGSPNAPPPPHEHTIVQQIGEAAIQSGASHTSTFRGPHDLLLVVAQPVLQGTGQSRHCVGAAWVMQRLPDAERGQSLQLLLTGAGFGAAALLTALLAWFLIAEVQGGVAAVTQRLSHVQRNLDVPTPSDSGTHVAEFDRLIEGIDAMAATLRTRIAKERALEEELRHKERLSSLGQFAAGVAHELRNPLATIRLRAQMSQHAPGGTGHTRNNDVILEEVDRLDTMIGRLLQFARPIALERQPMDVNALCHEVQASWLERTHAGVRITCQLAEDANLCGDRNRLQQVLDNVVENAVQASKPGDPIVLQTEALEKSVVIRVLDRGSGFDAAARTHAMDPFFTTKASGTGLGLSIAFEIVTAHNGTLTIEPNRGGGSVVSITLPAEGSSREETQA